MAEEGPKPVDIAQQMFARGEGGGGGGAASETAPGLSMHSILRLVGLDGHGSDGDHLNTKKVTDPLQLQKGSLLAHTEGRGGLLASIVSTIFQGFRGGKIHGEGGSIQEGGGNVDTSGGGGGSSGGGHADFSAMTEGFQAPQSISAVTHAAIEAPVLHTDRVSSSRGDSGWMGV